VTTPQAPLTVDQFRAIFTTFSDPAAYPDPAVQFWLDTCPADPCAWGSMYQAGQGWWTAHELWKFGPANALPGVPPPGISGPISSKGVGPVSVGYDPNIGTEEGAGQFNLTPWGKQYYHYACLFGMGPIQVGAVTVPPYGVPGFAWVGPVPLPGWFG
jgi:hypothetical protein